MFRLAFTTIAIVGATIVACSSVSTSNEERTGKGSQAVSAPSNDEPDNTATPPKPKDTLCNENCSKDGEGNLPGGSPKGLPPVTPPPPPLDPGGSPGGAGPGSGTAGDMPGGSGDPGSGGSDNSGGDDGSGGAGGFGNDDPGKTSDRPNKPGKGDKPEQPGKGKDAGADKNKDKRHQCVQATGGATITYEDEIECIDVAKWCVLDEDSLWRESCFQEESGNDLSYVSNCMYFCYRSDGSRTVEVSVELCKVSGHDRNNKPNRWDPACGDLIPNSHW